MKSTRISISVFAFVIAALLFIGSMHIGYTQPIVISEPEPKPIVIAERFPSQFHPQTFVKPTTGSIVQPYKLESHRGIDIQDGGSRPPWTDPECLAEAGSLYIGGVPLEYGNWKERTSTGGIKIGRDNYCDDWIGSDVWAAADGLVTFAGIIETTHNGIPAYSHVVKIDHGINANGQHVETHYWHMGTKIRDASGSVQQAMTSGEPVQNLIMVQTGQCVKTQTVIGKQGYSGRTEATHLHYVVKVGNDPVNPVNWFNRTEQIIAPASCSNLAFASNRVERYQIWQIARGFSDIPSQITTEGTNDQESRKPDWSVNGQIAYQFGASGVRGIHMISPETFMDVRLTCDPSDERDPSWSPDGMYLVYSKLQDADYELWIHRVGENPDCNGMGYDGDDYPLLVRPTSSDLRPSWSLDGDRIAFVTSGGDVGADAEIAVVSVVLNNQGHWVVDGEVTLLTDNSFVDFDPSWSPDGERIAYSTTRHGDREIYRMSSATCCEISSFRLTNNPAQDRDPAWSPDGSLIAFVSERDGNEEIYWMSAEDGEANSDLFVRVTNSSEGDNDPSWQR